MPEQRSKSVLTPAARLADALHELLELKPDELYVHHVGKEQQAFIEAFASDVLPGLQA